MRKFNITGNCIKAKHYMVDTSEKLEKIKALVDDGAYFTINRARQYGKTTTLYLLSDVLRSEYVCLKISFEGAGNIMFSSEQAFCNAFLKKLDLAITEEYPDSGIKWQNEDVVDFSELNAHISEICKNNKVVLLIDEVDKSSNNQIFLHFLGVLRSKYLARNGSGYSTFHSVILAGVHDVKNIKLKMITSGTHTASDGEGIYNSPWNIASDFDVDMSFNPVEIETMLTDYESEHAIGMDKTEIAQEIYGYTGGYPYLVSNLCKIIDEKLNKNWTKNGVQEAVKIILEEKSTLFDDLFKNLENNPELSELIYNMVIIGNEYPFNFYTPNINTGVMYGIFKKSNTRKAVISNQIFEMFITEYFVGKDLQSNGKNQRVTPNDVINNGRFNMETCLKKFTHHYYELFNESDIQFLERHGRLLFLSYLKPLINGTGFYHIETETRNSRRMDIILDYNREQFIIEMKLWHGEKYKEKAYEQLLEYMSAKNIDTGYLLTFDFRTDANKERQAEWIDFDNGRRIFDVVV